MKFGTVFCANSECEKELGFFPADTVPKNVELYCECCKEKLEKDEEINNAQIDRIA